MHWISLGKIDKPKKYKLENMKNFILPALKLTLFLAFMLIIIYPAVIWAASKLSPNGGMGDSISYQDQQYYRNIGQSFVQDRYFWSRPSAVSYNAAGSGGSNKGASNADYLIVVQARIDTLLAHNPGISSSQVPMDLVTASGSGLDPNISVQAAKIQVSRIAKIRGISEAVLQDLLLAHTEGPLLGLFGPEKINVLALNIALDKISNPNF